MTHKEMTAHIRKRLSVSGVKARVSMYESCGSRWIKVTCPAFDQPFTSDQQATIKHVASCNHLTMARGSDIPVEHVNPIDFHFVYSLDQTMND